MSTIDSSAAAALVAAAAGAAGPCPADPSERIAWERRVIDRAYGLIRHVPVVEALAACTSVTGVILSVKEHSGRGLITIRPTMGAVDDGKTEDFRTPFLNEPQGQAMFDQARSLVGHHCRFAKRVEEIDGGRKKVRMCEAIEDLGVASGSATVPDGRETGSAPAERIDDSATAPTERAAAPVQPRLVATGDAPATSGPVALCSDAYRKAILSMAKQLLADPSRRDTFVAWRTANAIPTLNDPTLTAEQAARVRTFLAGMYDQVGGAA